MAIYKRQDRNGKTRYMVRIESPDPITGTRRRVTVGTFATMKEAKIKQSEAITERERGTLLNPDTTTVGELLDRYFETEVPKTVKPENRAEYEVVIRRHLKPVLGNIKVRKLTVEHVERLFADLQAAGYSSTTIKKVHLRLGSALRLAKRWNIVHDNVCDVVKTPKLEYKKPAIWTPDNVAAFLDVAEHDSLYAYWLLLVETGARTSELLGATWSDIDLGRGTIRLGAQVVRLLQGTPIVKQDAKTEASRRTIRLTAGTVEELRAYRRTWLERKLASGNPDWNPHDLLFCTSTGKPYNSHNIRRTFNRIVKEAGVPAISPHGVRKSHITMAIANGANVKAVAARVGHADVTTTLSVYTSLTAAMDDELMSIMEAVVPHRKKGAG